MNLCIKLEETCKQFDKYELRYSFTKLTNISCHENDLCLCCNLIHSLPATKCPCLLYAGPVNANQGLEVRQEYFADFSVQLFYPEVSHFIQDFFSCEINLSTVVIIMLTNVQAVIIDKLWVCDTDANNSTTETGTKQYFRKQSFLPKNTNS